MAIGHIHKRAFHLQAPVEEDEDGGWGGGSGDRGERNVNGEDPMPAEDGSSLIILNYSTGGASTQRRRLSSNYTRQQPFGTLLG